MLELSMFLEKEMATQSSILAWKIPSTRSLAGYSPWGHEELGMTEQLPFIHVYFLNITKGWKDLVFLNHRAHES